MTSSKWLVLAATLAIVPPVAQAQTAATPPALVTSAPCRSARRTRWRWGP